MAPSAARLPECAECARRPVQARRPDSIPKLTPEELEDLGSEIERIRTEGGARHAVDLAGLVGEYHVEGFEHCSYFGHAHKNGILIRSRCGRLLSLGLLVCGRDVLGFGAVARGLEVLRKVEAARELQKTAPQLRAEIEGLAAEARGRLKGLQDLKSLLPEVHKGMQEALWYSKPGVDVPVTRIDPESGRKITEYQRHELRGLVLFANAVSEPKLDDTVSAAAAFAQEMDSIRIDEKNYGRVTTERAALRDRERRLREWLDEARKFWTEANLALALIKTYREESRFPKDVAVDGRTIIVGGMAAGINGARSLEDSPRP